MRRPRRPGRRRSGGNGAAASDGAAAGPAGPVGTVGTVATGTQPAQGAGPLLIWGLDGTLVDSYAAIRAAVHAALGAHDMQIAGPSWAVEAVLRPLVGLSLDRIFGRLVAHHDPDPRLIGSLVDAYRDAFRAAGPREARLFPGVAPLLAAVRAQGAVSVVACSDGLAADLLLERFELTDLVAGVVCDDDVARHRRKPDSGLVLSACAAHGYEPADVVVIGDSVFDVEMGQAAGADTVWVPWGNQSRGDLLERTPTQVAEDVDHLGSVLAGYLDLPRRDTAQARRPAAAVANRHARRMSPSGHTVVRPRRHRQWALGRCTPTT